MRFSTLHRYALPALIAAYSTVLVLLHLCGRFPAPGCYDVSRLNGSAAIELQGKVISFPQTRWGQTRCLFDGRADPLSAFHGRMLVTFKFPVEDLAPGERLWLRGWLSAPRLPRGQNPFNER